MTPCQVADPVLEPGHGLVGDASPGLRFVRDREKLLGRESGDGEALAVLLGRVGSALEALGDLA